MKLILFASLLLAGSGFAASTLPAAALPMPAAGLQAPGNADVTLVRSHRHYRRRQGSASRGNAGMPSRGAGAQQCGQTTGGPRR
ncbi:MAG: hypothetical protein INR70_27825 [Parafilimonas terrae]|nr:hypothetical protein [Parafilimonas terrae]